MAKIAQIDWNIVNATFAKYGVWGIGALALGLFLYKRLWPVALAHWEANQKARQARAELADKVLLDNAEQNRTMMNTTMKEFAEALRASNQESRSVVSQLQALTAETKKQNEHLEVLTNEVRRK